MIGTNEALCTEVVSQSAKLMEHMAPAIGRMGTMMQNMGELLSSNTSQDQDTGMYPMPKSSMWKILTNNYMIELLPLNFVQQLLFALLLLDEYEIIYDQICKNAYNSQIHFF